MVHKNRHLGSDQRFISHSNLFSCLSPPATRRNLCYPTSPSAIHDSQKLNKIAAKVSIMLNSVLPNIQAVTVLRPPLSPQWSFIIVTSTSRVKQQELRTLWGTAAPLAQFSVASLSPKVIISVSSISGVHVSTQFPSFTFCLDTKWQDLLLATES